VIRKAGALDRLHRIDGAFISVEKNTLTVFPFLQGQARPVSAQIGVLGDKIVKRHPEEIRDFRDLSIRYRNLPVPLAAVAASLALVEDSLLHVVNAHAEIIPYFRKEFIEILSNSPKKAQIAMKIMILLHKCHPLSGKQKSDVLSFSRSERRD